MKRIESVDGLLELLIGVDMSRMNFLPGGIQQTKTLHGKISKIFCFVQNGSTGNRHVKGDLADS